MKAYVWGLDLVRFAAALMVVMFHFSWQQSNPQIGFDAGWIGVEIFFVISGFVIMGSAADATPIEFAERRIARLYPAAIACALLNLSVLLPFGYLAEAYGLHVREGIVEFVSSVLLFGRVFQVSALWTIPVELAFYSLVMFILIAGDIRRVTMLSALLIGWSALYLIPSALSVYGLSSFYVGPLGFASQLTLVGHGCFFGVGILIWKVFNRRTSAVESVVLAAGILLCCVEILVRSARLLPDYDFPVRLSAMAGSALAAFSISIVVIWGAGRINNRITLPPLLSLSFRKLGLMTYPLYLTHEAVGGVTYGFFRQMGYGQGPAFLAGLGMSLAASLVIVSAVEPSLRRWLMGMLHPSLERLTSSGSFGGALGTFRS